MALGSIAGGQLYNIPSGPPPPGGDSVLRFDYRIYSIIYWLAVAVSL